MKYIVSLNAIVLMLLASACALNDTPENLTNTTPNPKAEETSAPEPLPSPSRMQAQVINHPNFESRHVQARTISVWVPDGYLPSGDQRYPVIYAHDGQNLFDPETSYGGTEWGLDETAQRLIAAGDLPPAIIVGIWNTDQRWQEYAPQKVVESLTGDTSSEWLGADLPQLRADAYLAFITEELKPFIDATYDTASEAEHTTIMGSSMGGLISLYAVAEHPETFSRAAAVSIHWPLTEPGGPIAQQADRAMQSYLETSGLDRTRHSLWFDHGTETLDAAYPPHADNMEAWFRAQGWQENQAVFRAYPGTDHSETAWAGRADDILTFLLSD